MAATLEPGLHWAIKSSFLEYVAKMPDGQCTVGAGARPAGGSVMLFEPDGTGSPTDSADLLLPFRGEVRFTGHGGMLDIRIHDPLLTANGSEGELSVLDAGSAGGSSRVPFARLTLVADTAEVPSRGWFSSDVRLTPEGSALFNHVYPAGEPLEPLLVRLPAPAAPTSAS